MPLRDILLRKSSRRMMMVLLSAVGLMLLIACANAANLLMARGASRQKEIAVRVAVGATRSRIVRQLLAEAAVLAVVGAAAGLMLSLWAVSYLATLPMLQAPGAPPVSIDLSVLAFAAGVTTLAMLASGVLPAWQSSHVSPIESLRCGTSATLGSTQHRRVRNTLVIAEVALTVVLLASAGLLVRRFVDLVHVNPGFDPSALLTMNISRTRDASPESARNFYEQTLDRVKALPGVESAVVSTTLPMVGWVYGIPFRRPDQPKEAIQRQFGIMNVVSAEYFQTLRLPIVRGRAFNAGDTATSGPVVIIDQHLAKRYFNDDDPIGKTLLVASPFDYKAEVAREVVGIAGDVKDSGIEQPIADDVYLPFEQYPVPWEYLSVRSPHDATALASSIRAAIASVDSDQPLEDIATMQQRVDESLHWSRFATNVLGGFAALSLLLAVGGIYGVIAYTTTQRTAEFGLRMALGARPATLLRFVVKRGAELVLAGSSIGIVAALVVARLLSNTAEGVKAHDPLVFVGALAVIMAAAVVAMLLPARRAANVDPMVALRQE
jgi:predicted permease